MTTTRICYICYDHGKFNCEEPRCVAGSYRKKPVAIQGFNSRYCDQLGDYVGSKGDEKSKITEIEDRTEGRCTLDECSRENVSKFKRDLDAEGAAKLRKAVRTGPSPSSRELLKSFEEIKRRQP